MKSSFSWLPLSLIHRLTYLRVPRLTFSPWGSSPQRRACARAVQNNISLFVLIGFLGLLWPRPAVADVTLTITVVNASACTNTVTAIQYFDPSYLGSLGAPTPNVLAPGQSGTLSTTSGWEGYPPGYFKVRAAYTDLGGGFTTEKINIGNVTITITGEGSCYVTPTVCYTNTYGISNNDPVSHSYGWYNNGVLVAYAVVGAGKSFSTSVRYCTPADAVPNIVGVCYDCKGLPPPPTPPNLLSDFGDDGVPLSSTNNTVIGGHPPGVDGSGLTNITFGGSSSALTEGTYKSGVQALYEQAGKVGAKIDADLLAANSHLLDIDAGIDLSNVKLGDIDSSIDAGASSVVTAVNNQATAEHTDSVAEKASTDAVKAAVDQVKAVGEEQKELLVTIANNLTITNPVRHDPVIPAELTNASAATTWANEKLGATGGKFDSIASALTPPSIGSIPHPTMIIPFAGVDLDLDPAVRFPGMSEFLHALFKFMISCWFIYNIVKLMWDTVQAHAPVKSGIPDIGGGILGYGANLFGLAVSLTCTAAAVTLWNVVFEYLLDWVLTELNVWVYLDQIVSANPIAIYLIFFVFPVQFAINALFDYLIARVLVAKLFLYATTAAKVLARA